VKRGVIVDTGPLVALLNRRDTHHPWASACLAEVEPPLLTCEAVLSETCYLVRTLPNGPSAVMELVRRGVLSLPFSIVEEADQIAGLLAKYASVPMSLADACIVRMAEQYPRSLVMTIDSDLSIYRKHRRLAIPSMMP
jgi:predicted nucleic acid-binding protein